MYGDPNFTRGLRFEISQSAYSEMEQAEVAC